MGELVYAIDPDTGERFATPLLDVRSAMRPCLRFELEDGRSLRTTQEHPLYCPENRSYAHARHWLTGELERLLVLDEGSPQVVRVLRVALEEIPCKVFDLGVEHELHNFIANGVVVHNKLPIFDFADPCQGGCDPMSEGECPKGERCVPQACEPGALYWTHFRCVEQLGDSSPGESCSIQDHLGGLDDCAPGSLCVPLTSEEVEGSCVAYCAGSLAEAGCPGEQVCGFFPVGVDVLPLCLDPCDPLAPECPEGFTCEGSGVDGESLCTPVEL